MATRRLVLLSPPALALAALVLASSGCVQDDGRRFNPIRTEVDPSDEREIGYAFDQQIQEYVPLIDDPVVLGTIHELGQSLVAHIQPQPFVYHFRIVEDPQLNAFAVPGGYIYLHSGTVMAAGSVDELAGVLGHEIGHVKGRHSARLQEDAALPNLLTSLAGLAAAFATGEPGFAVAAQGINVALQLRYTRMLEDEADQLGSIFMARAGYEPDGLVRFFERLEAGQRRGMELPPYLYSHPQAEDRIDTVERFCEGLTVADVPRVLSDPQLRAVQSRLGILLAEGRSSWPVASSPQAREQTAPLLARAEAERAEGRPQLALLELESAERLDPADPQLPFRRGELLEELRRPQQAARAYQRAIQLDPTPALSYYQAGRASRDAGDPVRASYYLEQAARRASPGGSLQRRAKFEVLKLTFPVVDASGVTRAAELRDPAMAQGQPQQAFSPDVGRLGWWGRISARWVPGLERLVVRWVDPEGNPAQEAPVERRDRRFAVAFLELGPDLRGRAGRWKV
ncbi:MAG: M48 family metalloprotease, partial [Myxococcota bacterium]